jgi:Fe-S-cluster-containing dehydrogenase component
VAPERFLGPQSHVWLRGGPIGSGAHPHVRPSPGCELSGGGVRCRDLAWSSLDGTVPTELGTLTALTELCVHCPLPPRLDACAVTGLWAEWGGDVGCRDLRYNSCTGTLPTELGTMDALTSLCVHLPHPPRLDACAITGMWAEWGGVVGCRDLDNNVITGTLPTELGTMDALTHLCVHRPHPPCLDVCAVTGLWAERGDMWGAGLYPPTVSRARCLQSWAPWTR